MCAAGSSTAGPLDGSPSHRRRCRRIGRQVALQLASIGVRRTANRRFRRGGPDQRHHPRLPDRRRGPDQCRGHKAAIAGLDPTIVVQTVCDRFRSPLDIGNAVFCCVDSITARSAIWRSASRRCDFWVDGRMLGEVLRIPDGRRRPMASPLSHDALCPGRSPVRHCTARSTIYAASIAAGLMVHQFTRWLRSLPIDPDISMNLLAGEYAVTPLPNP